MNSLWNQKTLPCALLDLIKLTNKKALNIISVFFNQIEILSRLWMIKILKMVLKYSSGTIIAFQDFFHQHEFGCWWRTHHHLRQTPRSRRHPFFIQSFFTLNTSLGQITLEDYFKMVKNASQFYNCSIHWLSL